MKVNYTYCVGFPKLIAWEVFKSFKSVFTKMIMTMSQWKIFLKAVIHLQYLDILNLLKC